jgi:lipid A ethanolaminephosphotransferase
LFKIRVPATPLTSNALLLLVAAFLVVICNAAFFRNLVTTYPLSGSYAPFLGSIVIVCIALNALLLALVCFGRATKPILVLVLLSASLAAYFMDSYGLVINDDMLRNAGQTDAAETRDLLTARLLVYFVCLGVLPAMVVARVPLPGRGWRRELISRAMLVGLLLVLTGVLLAAFGGAYASFFREHKALRGYANPAYFVYSAVKLTRRAFAQDIDEPVMVLGADAHIPDTDHERELIVLVVGETARSDRFSVNGYERETTPRIRAEDNIFSFTDFWACGTSTAVSVPCMFSMGGMANFDVGTAHARENLLDVLQHAGVNVIWLDNNSDSKGVALRADYRSFRSPSGNSICDVECRDEGMLTNLQAYIDSRPSGNIFIVLHQMGNHGPAYFKRYPASFQKFQPACQSSDLSQCSDQEIGRAYDNAILYTDHFLGQSIELLKRNNADFDTALLYLSDHGESLGEHGIYLHGLPSAIAPDDQLHVPAVIWLGAGFDDVDLPALAARRHSRFTHDNLVHTVLGLMRIQTALYRPELDILQDCRIAKHKPKQNVAGNLK